MNPDRPDPTDANAAAPPAVSVLMPVYNAERYVAQAVESILAQTFGDFEFLIVDDGSTDGSRAILDRYAARDPRIRLVSRPNTGYVVALNEMLGRARGALLARMDADDVARPDRFEHQVAFLRQHPEIVCLGGWFQMIDGAGRRLAVLRMPADHEALDDLMLRGRIPLCHPTLMMRREAVTAAGGYRPEFLPTEDLELEFRLGERGRLAALPRVLLDYRQHDQSISERQVRRQAEVAQAICDAVCDRRGLPHLYEPAPPWRPDGSRDSRHRFALKYGWWAYNGGQWQAALHYGLKAARLCPWRPDGWKLAVLAVLRRPTAAAAGPENAS